MHARCNRLAHSLRSHFIYFILSVASNVIFMKNAMTHSAARCECHSTIYLYITQLIILNCARKHKTMWNIIMVVELLLCWVCRVCRLSLASSLFIFKVNERGKGICDMFKLHLRNYMQIQHSAYNFVRFLLHNISVLFISCVIFRSDCGETLSIDNAFWFYFVFLVNLLVFIRSFNEIHTKQRLKLDVFFSRL